MMGLIEVCVRLAYQAWREPAIAIWVYMRCNLFLFRGFRGHLLAGRSHASSDVYAPWRERSGQSVSIVRVRAMV